MGGPAAGLDVSGAYSKTGVPLPGSLRDEPEWLATLAAQVTVLVTNPRASRFREPLMSAGTRISRLCPAAEGKRASPIRGQSKAAGRF